VPSYWGSVSPRRITKLHDPKEGGTVILQSFGNFTPNTTVSHPEGLESSNLKFQARGSVHHNSILIKIQLDATVGSLIYFTA